jgi:hypothetical protein
MKFFTLLRICVKNYPKPADSIHRLTSQSVGTIFAVKNLFFLYITFTHNRNMRNKMRKILENQRFEALRMLYACFTHTLRKLDRLQKTGYNKAP